MEEWMMIIISEVGAFFLGTVLFAFILRGFLGPYLKAKGGKGILLRVHPRGSVKAYFTVAVPDPKGSGGYVFKTGKQWRIFVPAEGSLIRCARVWMADIDEGSTAPYSWNFVKEIQHKVKEIVKEKNDKGEEIEVEKDVVRTKLIFFDAYENSGVLKNLLDWALIRPQRKLPGVGMDLKTVLILLGVIAAVVFVFIYMSSVTGGGPVI